MLQNIVGIPMKDWYSTWLNELYQEATDTREWNSLNFNNLW